MGQVQRSYTYGNYIDEPITMTTGDGTFWYHTNNLYNVRAMTDESGDVVERYRYTAYGEPTIYDPLGNDRSASAVGNSYMFQGRRYAPETELYYYRHRYYWPALGRFLQRDPLQTNLVHYDLQGPTATVDPLGLWRELAKTRGTARRSYQRQAGDTLVVCPDCCCVLHIKRPAYLRRKNCLKLPCTSRLQLWDTDAAISLVPLVW